MVPTSWFIVVYYFYAPIYCIGYKGLSFNNSNLNSKVFSIIIYFHYYDLCYLYTFIILYVPTNLTVLQY